MEGDELVADEVVAWGESRRDSECGFEGIEDGIAGPFPRILGSGDKTLVVDLDCVEFE